MFCSFSVGGWGGKDPTRRVLVDKGGAARRVRCQLWMVVVRVVLPFDARSCILLNYLTLLTSPPRCKTQRNATRRAVREEGERKIPFHSLRLLLSSPFRALRRSDKSSGTNGGVLPSHTTVLYCIRASYERFPLPSPTCRPPLSPDEPGFSRRDGGDGSLGFARRARWLTLRDIIRPGHACEAEDASATYRM